MGIILNYHRITNAELDPRTLCVSPQHFSEHLELVKKRATPIHLSELHSAARLPRKWVAITLDDGYGDNLYEASRLLRRFEMPATFFMTTGYLGSKRGFWQDELEHIFLKPGILPPLDPRDLCVPSDEIGWTVANSYSADEYERYRTWRLWDDIPPTPRQLLYRALHRAMKLQSKQERDELLGRLWSWSGTTRPASLSQAVLSGEEVVRLAQDELFEIGAHTVTHAKLAALDSSLQREEIFNSKHSLEQLLGRAIMSFAYPYGSQDDYTKETIELVKSAGFKIAVTTKRGVVRESSDRLELPRIVVGDWPGQQFAETVLSMLNDESTIAVQAPVSEIMVVDPTDLAEVQKSIYFNETWYLATYPDVAEARIDACKHYLLHGWREGRDPGPLFDSSWYLEKHQDVREAAMNPLLHYLRRGKQEGRLIRINPEYQSRIIREIIQRTPETTEVKQKTPKLIHYCWFGNHEFSDLNKRCMDSWRNVLQDYKIIQWNETNSPMNHEYAQRAYANGYWSRLSNFVRLYALYTNGGIYLDTDVEVLKNFDPLLQECCFAGFDATTEDTLEDGEWVAGGVIGTPPNHHFVKWALDLTCRLFEETGKFYKGPAVLTMLLKELGLKSYGSQMIKGVKLYPLEYFYPYPCGATFQKDCITDKTYSVHHWELSWVKQGYLQLHTREQK